MSKHAKALRFTFKMSLFALMCIAIILLLSLAFGLSPLGGESTSVSAQAHAKSSPLPVVILDPGHGGRDGGAVSVTGTAEKHLNLAVAKKLGEFLEAAGMRVVYTRTEDIALSDPEGGTKKTADLLARVKIARGEENPLFISLHMNTLPQEQYRGLQVFYTENNALSHAVASTVQRDARELLQKENGREAKNAGNRIYVLDRLDCPAVLVECGFISNHTEAHLLETEAYQNQLAFVLSRSILEAAEEMAII